MRLDRVPIELLCSLSSASSTPPVSSPSAKPVRHSLPLSSPSNDNLWTDSWPLNVRLEHGDLLWSSDRTITMLSHSDRISPGSICDGLSHTAYDFSLNQPSIISPSASSVIGSVALDLMPQTSIAPRCQARDVQDDRSSRFPNRCSLDHVHDVLSCLRNLEITLGISSWPSLFEMEPLLSPGLYRV